MIIQLDNTLCQKKLIIWEIIMQIKATKIRNLLIKVTKVINHEVITKVSKKGRSKISDLQIVQTTIKTTTKLHQLKVDAQSWMTLFINLCKCPWKIKRVPMLQSRILRHKWGNCLSNKSINTRELFPRILKIIQGSIASPS